MGRISGFDVLNRTSSNYYKDMTLQEIASDSDRKNVVKVGVTCLGDDICFEMKVIEAEKEKTIWIGEYSEARSEIPNLYNRLTKQIAEEVKTKLTANEELVLAESQAVDTAAYAAYTNGLLDLDKMDRNSLQKASEYFNIAAEIEPDWAPPYAGLAMVGAYRMQMSFIPPSVARQKIFKNLIKALELDPNSADSQYAKAVIAVWTEWD